MSKHVKPNHRRRFEWYQLELQKVKSQFKLEYYSAVQKSNRFDRLGKREMSLPRRSEVDLQRFHMLDRNDGSPYRTEKSLIFATRRT